MTLAASSAVKAVLSDMNCWPNSLPILTPTRADAATSNWWLKARAEGSFTISHTAFVPVPMFAYELSSDH